MPAGKSPPIPPRIAWAAAAFVAGVILADLADPGRAAVVVASLAGLACLTGAWWRHRRLPDPAPGDLLPRVPPLTAGLLLVGAIAIGFADLGARTAARAGSALPGLDGRVVEIQARVASDPRPQGSFGAWAYTVKSVVVHPSTPQPTPVTGRLALRSYGGPPAVELGDVVWTEVKLARLDLGEPFDMRLARRGVVATAAPVAPVEVESSTGNLLLGASNRFRARMADAAAGSLNPNQAFLLQGLVIGDDRRVEEQVRDDFRASGLSHLTAVSGANVAMVLGALALLLNALRVPRRPSIIIGMAAIVVFTTITRWEPSVLRAAVMATVALCAFLMGRIPTPAHAFAVAFLGLVAFDPMVFWSVGFQLSFAATAGLLWLRPPLLARLTFLPRPLAEALAMGIAAQVAVFPLIALHFGRISVAAIPANLAAFALVAPATILGLVGGVASLISPVLAWPFMKVAGWFVSVLQWVSKIFGRSDAAEITVPNFAAPETVGSYLVIGALWLLLGRRTAWARWPGLLGAVLLVGATLLPALGHTAPSGLRVTFFDVGAGDAALVESPAGARILIDGGRDPDLIATTLRRRGFERIDLVVASHMHADHVIGLQLVLRRFDVALALHPGVRAPMLFPLAAEKPMEAVGSGESIRLGDITVDFLGPTNDLREMAALSVSAQRGPEGPGLNDASVVMRVNWAGECVLFTGDLEEAGQQELLDHHPQEIGCTVMKAPHHGSGRLLAEFVEAVDPEWVPVSVGPNNYGHPSPKALEIFDSVGARVLRTDEMKDVVVEIDSAGRVTSKR